MVYVVVLDCHVTPIDIDVVALNIDKFVWVYIEYRCSWHMTNRSIVSCLQHMTIKILCSNFTSHQIVFFFLVFIKPPAFSTSFFFIF